MQEIEYDTKGNNGGSLILDMRVLALRSDQFYLGKIEIDL